MLHHYDVYKYSHVVFLVSLHNFHKSKSSPKGPKKTIDTDSYDSPRHDQALDPGTLLAAEGEE